MITSDTLCSELETMLEIDSGTIKGTESLEDLYWDSMTVVMFIAMADQKFNIAVSPSALAKAKTVADLLQLLSSPTS